ncbi:hypothetical protein [Geosporobacter ferrireducens]|uniref:TRASH domain-containing protein n=1 Tax=Geosporobacter ferrireducens TaxID=1424294 RepID=A0A1D8GEP2_9FIRM|nr:hypothetical protein [Geosporobacter ferrireducens]AOT69379.1 hypothetical protein Gferi_07215 [Geosporobacter ferrireducens]MTI57070.1 hypothetical protein [Geosporobacter ferrireducens]
MNVFVQLIWIFALALVIKRIFKKMIPVRVSPLKDNVRKDSEWGEKKDLVKEIHAHRERLVEMVEDEYCNVYIPEDKAYPVIDVHGKTHYFCSLECREKYLLEHRHLKAS